MNTMAFLFYSTPSTNSIMNTVPATHSSLLPCLLNIIFCRKNCKSLQFLSFHRESATWALRKHTLKWWVVFLISLKFWYFVTLHVNSNKWASQWHFVKNLSFWYLSRVSSALFPGFSNQVETKKSIFQHSLEKKSKSENDLTPRITL